MFEVLTQWTIPSGINTRSVMYFAEGVGLAAARQSVNTLFTNVRSLIGTGVTWQVLPDARVLDETTGTMTGIETDATARVGSGNAAALFVADATQVLLTWTTGRVINGRFVKGRTFVPGLDANLLAGGNLGAGTQATFAGAAQALAGSASGFGVWHRPKGGVGGILVPTTGGGCNKELAVLRRRRNR